MLLMLLLGLLCVVASSIAFVFSARLARRGRTGVSMLLMLVGASVPPLIGVLVTTISLIGVFGDVANVDASQKAKIMAAGISSSMRPTAIGIGTGLLLLLCGAAMLAIMAARHKESTSPHLQSTFE